MLYKYQYLNGLERDRILTDNPDKRLLEVQNITEGNFLVFTDEPVVPDEYTVLSGQVGTLTTENAVLQMSMMEMTMYAASQDERLQTQENAVMELSMIVAGGGL